MKNIGLLLLLLLVVNCTTEPADVIDLENLQAEVQMCVDDLPQVRIVNNGTHNYDFIIYDLDNDYAQLFVNTVATSSNSNWIELPSYNVVVVASNVFDYGQKVPLILENCDTVEVAIDANDILVEL